MTVDNSSDLTGFARYLAVTTAATTTAIVGLTRNRPATTAATLEESLAALGWTIVGVLGAWIAVTSVAYLTATALRVDWAEQLLRPVTAQFVRRIAIGITSTALSLPTPALATSNPQPVVEVHTPPVPGLSMDSTPTPILEPLPVTETSPTPMSSNTESIDQWPVSNADTAEEETGSYVEPLTWLVRNGDHLWSIAGTHLEVVLGTPPSLEQHDRYWRLLVTQATPHLTSGDPDLIYPGEHIHLPPLLDADIQP